MSFQDFLQRKLLEALAGSSSAPVGNPFQNTPYRPPMAGPMPQELAPPSRPAPLTPYQVAAMVAQQLGQSSERSIPRIQYAQPPGPMPADLAAVMGSGTGHEQVMPTDHSTDGLLLQPNQPVIRQSDAAAMSQGQAQPPTPYDLGTEDVFTGLRNLALEKAATGTKAVVGALPDVLANPVREVGHGLHWGMENVLNKPYQWNVEGTGEDIYQASQGNDVDKNITGGYGYVIDPKAGDFARDPKNKDDIAKAYNGFQLTDAQGNGYVYTEDGEGHKKGDPMIVGYVARDKQGNIIAIFPPGKQAVWELYEGTTTLRQRGVEMMILDPLSIPELLSGAGEFGKAFGVGMQAAEAFEGASKAGKIGRLDRAGRIIETGGEILTLPQKGIEAGLKLPFQAAGYPIKRAWSAIPRAEESSRILTGEEIASHGQSPVIGGVQAERDAQAADDALHGEYATTVEKVDVPTSTGGTKSRWQPYDKNGEAIGNPVATKTEAVKVGDRYTTQKVAERKGQVGVTAPEDLGQPQTATATMEPPTIQRDAPPNARPIQTIDEAPQDPRMRDNIPQNSTMEPPAQNVAPVEPPQTLPDIPPGQSPYDQLNEIQKGMRGEEITPVERSAAEPDYDALQAKYENATKADLNRDYDIHNQTFGKEGISVWDPLPNRGLMVDDASFGVGATPENAARRTEFWNSISDDVTAQKELDQKLEHGSWTDFNEKVAAQVLGNAEFQVETILPAYKASFGDIKDVTEVPWVDRGRFDTGKNVRNETDVRRIKGAIFSADENLAQQAIAGLARDWAGKPWAEEFLARIKSAREEMLRTINEPVARSENLAENLAPTAPPIDGSQAAAGAPSAEEIARMAAPSQPYEGRVYHGSPKKGLESISANPPTHAYPNGQSEFGAFFSPNSQYVDRTYVPKGGQIYPKNFRLEHPYYMDLEEFAQYGTALETQGVESFFEANARKGEEARKFRAKLTAEGYDGIIVGVKGDPIPREIVSFKDVPTGEAMRPHELRGAELPPGEQTLRPEDVGGVEPAGGVDALRAEDMPGRDPQEQATFAQAANQSVEATKTLSGKPMSSEVEALTGDDIASVLQRQGVIDTDEAKWWQDTHDIPKSALKKKSGTASREPRFGYKSRGEAATKVPAETETMSAAELYGKMYDLYGKEGAWTETVKALKASGYAGVDFAKQMPLLVRAIDKANAYFRANLMFGLATGIRGGLTDGLTDSVTGAAMGGPELAARTANAYDKVRVWTTELKGEEHAISQLPSVRNVTQGTGITLPPDMGPTLFADMAAGKHLPGTNLLYKVMGEGTLGKVTHGITTTIGLTPSKLLADMRFAIGEHTRVTFFDFKFQKEIVEAKTRFANSVDAVAAKAGMSGEEWITKIDEEARTRAKTEGWEYKGWNFSPTDVRNATGSEALARMWQGELKAAKREATAFMHKGLFHYGDFNKADAVLKRTFLFHFWYSRQVRLYGRLALENPWLTGTMWRMWKGLQNEAEKEGLPSWAQSFFKIMGSTDGFYHMTNVYQTFIPFAMFSEVGDENREHAGDNVLDKFINRSPFFVAPVITTAATALGYKHGSPANLIGSQSTRNLIRAMINLGATHGVDFLKPVEGHADPIAAWTQKIEQKAAKWADSTLPFAHYEKLFGTDVTENKTLNLIVTEIQEAKYGPMTEWDGAEGDAHRKETAAAMRAIEEDDSENPIAQEAREKYFGAKGPGALLNAVVPGGDTVRYGPYDQNTALTSAGYDARDTKGQPVTTTLPDGTKVQTQTPAISTGEPAPENQAAMDKTKLIGSAQPEFTSAVQGYDALGSPEQRDTYDIYNKIAFGNIGADEIVEFDGHQYTKAYLKRHPDESRALADKWAQSVNGQPAIDAIQGLQSDYEATNPEITNLKSFRKGMRDYTGGPIAAAEYYAAGSPSFKAYWDGSAKDEAAAMNADAYLAWKGEPLKLGDPTLDAQDPTKIPVTLPGSGGGGSGGSGQGGSDPVAALTKSLDDYNQKLAVADQVAQQYTNGKSDYEHLDPYAKQYVDQQLDLLGIKPAMGATLTYYTYWRDNMVAPGEDDSPAAFIAWRKKYLGGDLSTVQNLVDQVS